MATLGKKTKSFRLPQLFEIKAGDFHATKELDTGKVPLISCGDEDNGLVGFFQVPKENIYERCLTVAFNGTPLLTKFHPYRFGAKDDVAVLIPRESMPDSTLLYIAALLNRMTWRYSYGRKCFRQKLEGVSISLPVARLHSKLDQLAMEKIAKNTKYWHELARQCRSLRATEISAKKT